MPKIRIRERDLTTNPLVGSTTNYILYVIPEKYISNIESSTNATIEEIVGRIGKSTEDTGSPTEISLEEAKALELVIKTNKFLSEAITLGGKVIVANGWKQAKDYCGDRNQYDIKFILAKEIAGEEEDTYDHKELKDALDIAQKRKDCAVVYTKVQDKYDDTEEPIEDPAKDEKANFTEKDLLENNCNYIVTTSEGGNTDKAFFKDEVKTPAGKYVLPFYANGANGVHDINDSSIQLDAGQAYILAFLNNVAQGRAEWLAIAGSVRGAIPYNYKVDGFLKEEKIDSMQLRTYDANNLIAINPIVNMNPWGTRIWGNRTCLPNNTVKNEDATANQDADQLVASSFANIRIAICDIKKALYKAARKYQFEQNTDVLWVNFTSEVNSLLEEMKSSYGIVGYR